MTRRPGMRVPPDDLEVAPAALVLEVERSPQSRRRKFVAQVSRQTWGHEVPDATALPNALEACPMPPMVIMSPLLPRKTVSLPLKRGVATARRAPKAATTARAR